ncbi:MAG: hypothetical protein QHI48_09710 [Bacteroidota bacterium]|nr:hypothetical protein [Bacteroidota bacterium]
MRSIPKSFQSVAVVFFTSSLVAGYMRAQETADRFDPIVFLATVKLAQQYADGVFILPPHTSRFYTDTLHLYSQVVGFTMVTRDSNPAGWVVAMDFDADNFGALRLAAFRAVKRIPSADTVSYPRLVRWTESMLHERLRDRQDVTDTCVRWTWIQRYGYRLEIRRRAVTGGEVLLEANLVPVQM